MFIIATDTARQAVFAVAAKVAKEVEATVENVAEAVPPVMNDNTSAPRPLRALNMPTVAKRSTANVARVMFIRKPLETNCPVISSRFINAICTRAT